MLPRSVRIFVCTTPQDMRRSFDTLALVVKEQLGIDPQSGVMVAFVNKRANRLKVLWWDQNGYCLLYKRIHGAVFRLPGGGNNGERPVQIDGQALARLLTGEAKKKALKIAA